MMRFKFVLFIIALITGLGARGNTVALSRASGTPGAEVELQVSMTGSEAVTAMELHIPAGEAMTYVEGSARLSERAQGFAVQGGMTGTLLKLYIYSPVLGTIKGDEGVVLTFRVRLGETAGSFSLMPEVMLGSPAGAKVECTAEAGEVVVRAPRLELRTPKIDFGRVPIRSTYHRSVEIANTGNEPMQVSGFEASDPAVVSVSPATATIAPGTRALFDMAFAPQQRGVHSSTLKVKTDAVNGKPYSRWPEVQIAAQPFSVNELHVSRAEGVADSEVTVSLRMNNMEPIVATQIEIELPDGIKYVEGSAALSARASNHTVNSMVSGRMLKIVVYSNSNTPFKDEDGELLSFRVVPNASSGWYRLNPKRVILSNVGHENMTSATSSEYLVVQSPTMRGEDKLDFGEQPITAPVRAQYEVRNTGQVPLVVDRVIFLAEGYSVLTPLPLTVEAGGRAMLEIGYTAERPATFSTVMNLYNNDPTTRIKQVALSGRVYSPNALTVAGSYSAEEGYVLSIGLDNHADITAAQFDITIDRPQAISEPMSVSVTDRTQGYSAVASKVAENRYRVVMFNMANTPIKGKSGAILSVRMPAGEPIEAVNFGIDNVVLSTPSGENLTSPNVDVEIAVDTTTPGDANRDDRITVADATTVANHILGLPNNYFNAHGADANSDGNISAGDVTYIINAILQADE